MEIVRQEVRRGMNEEEKRLAALMCEFLSSERVTVPYENTVSTKRFFDVFAEFCADKGQPRYEVDKKDKHFWIALLTEFSIGVNFGERGAVSSLAVHPGIRGEIANKELMPIPPSISTLQFPTGANIPMDVLAYLRELAGDKVRIPYLNDGSLWRWRDLTWPHLEPYMLHSIHEYLKALKHQKKKLHPDMYTWIRMYRNMISDYLYDHNQEKLKRGKKGDFFRAECGWSDDEDMTSTGKKKREDDSSMMELFDLFMNGRLVLEDPSGAVPTSVLLHLFCDRFLKGKKTLTHERLRELATKWGLTCTGRKRRDGGGGKKINTTWVEGIRVAEGVDVSGVLGPGGEESEDRCEESDC
eukprot:jgi/Mesvir1/27/Mv06907-RA.1